MARPAMSLPLLLPLPVEMSSEKKRVLFIYQTASSFVGEDIRILQEAFDVTEIPFGAPSGSRFRKVVGLVAGFARQAARLIRELPRTNLVYGWFADYHMALPVLFSGLWRKPVVISVGGMDAVAHPQMGYGVFQSKWRAPLTRYIVRRAALLLPVTEALIQSENRFSTWPAPSRKNGLAVHVDGFTTPTVVLPTGYDPDAWPMGPEEREPIVLTVALVGSKQPFLLKGIDHVIRVANELPDVTFRVVGVTPSFGDYLQHEYEISANVNFLPPVPQEELVDEYHAASVYLQLSRAEGMPNVVCEAMLCGCIPVGSNVFGIPDAIGDAGFIVETPEAKQLTTVLRQAISSPPERRHAARSRIFSRFSRTMRRDRLLELLHEQAS